MDGQKQNVPIKKSNVIKKAKDVMRYKVRVVLSGGRNVTDKKLTFDFLDCDHEERFSDVKPRDLIYIIGMAPGFDTLAVEWCVERGHDYHPCYAEWDNLMVPGAVVKINQYGNPYNVRAGHERNEKMVLMATHGGAMWDGKSKGTSNAIETMAKHKISYRVKKVEITKEAPPKTRRGL